MMTVFRGLLVFLYIACDLSFFSVLCFNVETDHYAIYHGADSSMFGFSVAGYYDRKHRGWVIVGAPQNRTNRPNTIRGGAVFRCDIADDDRCYPIDFDRDGPSYVRVRNAGSEPIDNKTMQWFGATISASSEDGGPIMACAPRYNWFGYVKANLSVAGFKDAVGTCWVSNLTDAAATEFSPCRSNDAAGHNRQGMCQAGIGAAIAKDGKTLFIGAPGSWYWQGQLFVTNSNKRLPFIPKKEVHRLPPDVQGKAQAYYTEDTGYRATKEGPAYEDNSYLGYSVTVGDFLGTNDSGVAVGVPRGAELRGKVVLLTEKLMNHRNLTGEQMGAYFGYSLAANDVDGDGLEDLIVGAPMYTIEGNPEMKIETGRIYVYYQGNSHIKYQQFHSRDGESNRGRFGLSVASLGDMDLDGYGDIAVGAPYGGYENRGAVYIYRGSKTGIEEKYSQVILSEQLERPVRTFGFSLSGGLDLDGNDYPDLIVGAYESNTALFFRSRPVIKMESKVEFVSTTDLISLDQRNCILSDGTAVPCLELKACCKYTGVDVWSEHMFTVHYVLDAKKAKNPRMFLLTPEGRNTINRTITVLKDRLHCQTTMVYVVPNVRDKLTSLDVEVRWSLLNEHSTMSSGHVVRDPRRKLQPVLGPTSTWKKDSLSIQKNCGSDNVCVPDLTLKVTPNVDKYLLGSGRRLELNVIVQNLAEDAFESMYYLHLPPGMDYVNIESIDSTSQVAIQCSAPKSAQENVLRCDIGNPLPQRKLVNFKVFLQPMVSHGMKANYDLYMVVNSTNPEKRETLVNNYRNLSIPIWIETELLLEGEKRPKDLYYNPESYCNCENPLTDAEMGPLVTHNYTIRNQGPSSVLKVAVSLVWPAETLAGDILLYLLEQPDISDGPIKCDSANANYLSLQLQESKRRTYSSYSSNREAMNERKSHETIRDNNDIRQGSKGIVQTNTHEQNEFGRQSEYGRHDEHGRHDEQERHEEYGRHDEQGRQGEYGRHDEQGRQDEYGRHDEYGGPGDYGRQGEYGRQSEEDSLYISSEDNVNERFQTGPAGSRSRGESGIVYQDNVEKNVGHHGSHQNGSFNRTWGYTDHARVTTEATFLSVSSEQERHGDRTTVGGNSRFDRIEDERRREMQQRNQYEDQFYHRNQWNHQNAQDNVNLHRSNSRGNISLTTRHHEEHNINEPPANNGDQYLANLYPVDTQEITHDLSRSDEHYNSDYRDFYKLFERLSSNPADFKTYEKYGRSYMQFYGRFKTTLDGVKAIELRNGKSFTIGQHGDKNLADITNNEYYNRNFIRIDAEFVPDLDNVIFHCQLRDGRTIELRSTLDYLLKEQSRGLSYHETYIKSTENRRTYQTQINANKRIRRDANNGHSGVTPEIHVDKGENGNGICETSKCVSLQCYVGPLEKDEEVWVAAKYRINVQTLKKVAFQEPIKVSTKLEARVVEQPFIGEPAERVIRSHEIHTKIEPTPTNVPTDIVPLWIVVVSACAGAIILLLIIYLLYKFGFFKRTRPSDTPERQPLNRNGHYSD